MRPDLTLNLATPDDGPYLISGSDQDPEAELIYGWALHAVLHQHAWDNGYRTDYLTALRQLIIRNGRPQGRPRTRERVEIAVRVMRTLGTPEHDIQAEIAASLKIAPDTVRRQHAPPTRTISDPIPLPCVTLADELTPHEDYDPVLVDKHAAIAASTTYPTTTSLEELGRMMFLKDRGPPTTFVDDRKYLERRAEAENAVAANALKASTAGLQPDLPVRDAELTRLCEKWWGVGLRE